MGQNDEMALSILAELRQIREITERIAQLREASVRAAEEKAAAERRRLEEARNRVNARLRARQDEPVLKFGSFKDFLSHCKAHGGVIYVSMITEDSRETVSFGSLPNGIQRERARIWWNEGRMPGMIIEGAFED